MWVSEKKVVCNTVAGGWCEAMKPPLNEDCSPGGHLVEVLEALLGVHGLVAHCYLWWMEVHRGEREYSSLYNN